MAFAILHAPAAEVADDMRTFARMLAALEACDLKHYCTTMSNDPSYVGYVNRVGQTEVKNRMKKPEDCSPENIAQQIKADNVECLAMPAAEFENTALRGAEAGKAFVKQTAAQGVDGEKLIQEERARLR